MALLTAYISPATNTSIQRDVVSKKKGSESVTAITFDATLEESLEADSEVTEHPIEDGSTIADHIILKAKVLTLNGVISETPLGLASALRGLSSAAGSYFGGKVFGKVGKVAGGVAAGYGAKALGSLISGSKTGSRAKDAMEELILARDAKSPIKIQTALKMYPSATETNTKYVIQKLVFSRDKDTGKAVKVSITFKEIRIVKFKTTKADKSNVKSASSQKSLGKKIGDKVDEAKEKGKSLAKSAGGFLKNAWNNVFGSKS